MDDELTPEQKFAAENPETMVPRALMQGRSPEDIAAELVRLEWSPQAARAFVARVKDDMHRFHASPESRERLVKEARTQLFAGLLLALLAAGITAFTLLAALGGALPFFVVTFGVFIGGLILASRGWTRWRLYRSATLPFQPSQSVEAEHWAIDLTARFRHSARWDDGRSLLRSRGIDPARCIVVYMEPGGLGSGSVCCELILPSGKAAVMDFAPDSASERLMTIEGYEELAPESEGSDIVEVRKLLQDKNVPFDSLVYEYFTVHGGEF